MGKLHNKLKKAQAKALLLKAQLIKAHLKVAKLKERINGRNQ